jgi:hypothetical protein
MQIIVKVNIRPAFPKVDGVSLSGNGHFPPRHSPDIGHIPILNMKSSQQGLDT